MPSSQPAQTPLRVGDVVGWVGRWALGWAGLGWLAGERALTVTVDYGGVV